MEPPRRSSIRLVVCVALIASIALLAAGCGSGDRNGGGSDADTTAPSAAAHRPDLQDADPRLQKIYDQANVLLPGGRAAYLKRIESLAGLPVVVNKWGSWCGPCRKEFPLFQDAAKRYGDRVAFLGVNVNDVRRYAREFLAERPVPYPSYIDDRLEISKLLPPLQGAPTTGFYDRSGKLVHVKIGEYKNAAALRADIERYAEPG